VLLTPCNHLFVLAFDGTNPATTQDIHFRCLLMNRHIRPLLDAKHNNSIYVPEDKVTVVLLVGPDERRESLCSLFQDIPVFQDQLADFR
jgi:hypothetical protein